jgi:hypothetical protein
MMCLLSGNCECCRYAYTKAPQKSSPTSMPCRSFESVQGALAVERTANGSRLTAQALEHLEKLVGIGQLAGAVFFPEAETARLVHDEDGSLGAVALGVVDTIALGDGPVDIAQERIG